MLISSVPDNKFAFKRFRDMPSKLIIDSGALYYMRNKSKLKDVFEIQKTIIHSSPSNIDIRVAHLDEPLLNKTDLSMKYGAIEKTLVNAYEHMDLFVKEGFSKNICLMGVIQGFNEASLQFSIHELKKIGYKQFGIGSLLGKSAFEQIKLINYVTSIVGAENLHVFGVTGIKQIKAMNRLNIGSFDSSRPTMVAVYHQLFYSNPFRTYLVSSSNVAKAMPKLDKPLDCDCPICIEQPEAIFNLSHRDFMKLRSIHNYYHFAKTVEFIKQKKGDE